MREYRFGTPFQTRRVMLTVQTALRFRQIKAEHDTPWTLSILCSVSILLHIISYHIYIMVLCHIICIWYAIHIISISIYIHNEWRVFSNVHVDSNCWTPRIANGADEASDEEVGSWMVWHNLSEKPLPDGIFCTPEIISWKCSWSYCIFFVGIQKCIT